MSNFPWYNDSVPEVVLFIIVSAFSLLPELAFLQLTLQKAINENREICKGKKDIRIADKGILKNFYCNEMQEKLFQKIFLKMKV